MKGCLNPKIIPKLRERVVVHTKIPIKSLKVIFTKLLMIVVQLIFK
jgi:hypothetical protein